MQNESLEFQVFEDGMQNNLNVESCNSLALRSAARAVSAFYDRYLAPTGLSSVQFSILAAINSASGTGLQDLSGQLIMDRTSLVRAIQPLTRDGYIERRRNPENSRKRAVSLTAQGREKFAEAESFWRQAQAEFEEGIGPSKSFALRGELSALAHKF